MTKPFHPTAFRFACFLVVFHLTASLSCQQVSFADPTLDPEYKLLLSATLGDTATIRLLTELGTDINIQSTTGDTPLMLAVLYNQMASVSLMLELGADPEIYNYLGERPLHAAIKDENLPIAELLIRYGADINPADINGATPLHYAALYGFWYEADMLIYYDADIDRKTLDGTTPLMAAVMAGSYDIADVLINEGADVNAIDGIGYTPLMTAAQNGDTIMSDLLLKNGASLYATASDGYNAASVSVRDGHPEFFRYIYQKGNLWDETTKVNPWLVADQYRRSEFIPILRYYNIARPQMGESGNISAGISLFASWHQYFTGLQLSSRSDHSGIGIVSGLDFKPFKSRILLQEDDYNYSQYIDKRSLIYAGLFKDFVIANRTKTLWMVTITGKAAWKFGNRYPGTSLKPEHGFAFIPAASISMEVPLATFFISAEYMRTEVYKSGPLWLRTGININYYFNNVKSKGKTIRWY